MIFTRAGKRRVEVSALFLFIVSHLICKISLSPRYSRHLNTVESRFNDLRYNDIPGITINNLLPTK